MKKFVIVMKGTGGIFIDQTRFKRKVSKYMKEYMEHPTLTEVEVFQCEDGVYNTVVYDYKRKMGF